MSMIKLQVTISEGDKEVSVTREVDRAEAMEGSVATDPVARVINYMLRRMVDDILKTVKE